MIHAALVGTLAYYAQGCFALARGGCGTGLRDLPQLAGRGRWGRPP